VRGSERVREYDAVVLLLLSLLRWEVHMWWTWGAPTQGLARRKMSVQTRQTLHELEISKSRVARQDKLLRQRTFVDTLP